jgi:hypothetical protein
VKNPNQGSVLLSEYLSEAQNLDLTMKESQAQVKIRMKM